MGDSSVTKVESRHSPRGEMGQIYLASGKAVAMRLWREHPGTETVQTSREYETVGYVIEGRAELESEGQRLILSQGDSWVVPKGARHCYRILEAFTGIEATSPPSHVHGRDVAPEQRKSAQASHA